MRRIFLILVILLTACQPVATESAFKVRLHPDGPLFVGDQVSFEILGPDDEDHSNSQVQIALEEQAGFGPDTVAEDVAAFFVKELKKRKKIN